jgi:branched-chain amino acid transport system permease protein
MGVLNFAHGAFLTVGAFFGFWYAKKYGFMITTPKFLLSMLIGGIGAGLFALLMEQLLITRMYERHIDQACSDRWRLTGGRCGTWWMVWQ